MKIHKVMVTDENPAYDRGYVLFWLGVVCVFIAASWLLSFIVY